MKDICAQFRSDKSLQFFVKESKLSTIQYQFLKPCRLEELCLKRVIPQRNNIKSSKIDLKQYSLVKYNILLTIAFIMYQECLKPGKYEEFYNKFDSLVFKSYLTDLRNVSGMQEFEYSNNKIRLSTVDLFSDFEEALYTNVSGQVGESPSPTATPSQFASIELTPGFITVPSPSETPNNDIRSTPPPIPRVSHRILDKKWKAAFGISKIQSIINKNSKIVSKKLKSTKKINQKLKK